MWRAGGMILANVNLLRRCWTGQQPWPGPKPYQKQASGQGRWMLLGPTYAEFLHFWATQNHLSWGGVVCGLEFLKLDQEP